MKRERSLSRSRPRPFPVKAEPRPTSPLKRERSPSVPRAREASVKKRSPSPRRSPPPVQPPVPKIEATEVPLPAASEPPILNKGKAKAEPPAEPDVKMRSPSPPPAQVRAAAPPSQPRIFHRRTSRSPPRGPRDHDTFARPHAPTEESKPSPNPPPSRAPLADLADRIPTLPPHKPRPNPIQEIEAELKRIEATRAHLAAERVRTLRATRRAQHELDLVSIDLRMAEGRRRVADQQVEQARIGQLGIDAAK
ncbi:hypothetical protein PLICRDRAFT_54536 [Plicaturopsis crispa FD-325 SS-3]|nr:hypothetical protein PLICRDRAFT_54536 [Plicaturopsis crispa FD-325 SS-3]